MNVILLVELTTLFLIYLYIFLRQTSNVTSSNRDYKPNFIYVYIIFITDHNVFITIVLIHYIKVVMKSVCSSLSIINSSKPTHRYNLDRLIEEFLNIGNVRKLR